MLRTFVAFVKLAQVILISNKLKTNKLFSELNQELSKFGFELSEAQRKRIFFYTAQSAITNHWFSQLRGFKPTASEAKNAIYLGAFTPIADDLMDGQNITFEALLAQKKTDTSDAVLFAYLYDKLQASFIGNPQFESYFVKAHEAQNESLKQLCKTKLTTDQLKLISYNKGGFYTLLYRMVLSNKPVPNEEEAIYTLGAIMQLLNDLFDMHKDYHNKSQTLVTSTADLAFVKSQLEELEHKFISLYRNLDYPKSHIRNSLSSIMAIVTRGHVALIYYQKLQGTKEKLPIENYERKDLIVDMEKPKNIWRNLIACKNALHKYRN